MWGCGRGGCYSIQLVEAWWVRGRGQDGGLVPVWVVRSGWLWLWVRLSFSSWGRGTTFEHAQTWAEDGDKADLGGNNFGSVGVAERSFSLEIGCQLLPSSIALVIKHKYGTQGWIIRGSLYHFGWFRGLLLKPHSPREARSRGPELSSLGHCSLWIAAGRFWRGRMGAWRCGRWRVVRLTRPLR